MGLTWVELRLTVFSLRLCRPRGAIGEQTIEIIAGLRDRGIERLEASYDAGLHHAALHHREHERRKLLAIEIIGESGRRILKTLLHPSIQPWKFSVIKLGDVGMRVCEFQREVADRAPVRVSSVTMSIWR